MTIQPSLYPPPPPGPGDPKELQLHTCRVCVTRPRWCSHVMCDIFSMSLLISSSTLIPSARIARLQVMQV